MPTQIKDNKAASVTSAKGATLTAEQAQEQVTVTLTQARITKSGQTVIMAKQECNGNVERWFNMIKTPTMSQVNASDAKQAGKDSVTVTTTRAELFKRGMITK